MSINVTRDGPFISKSMREAADLCTNDQAALAARLRLGADVLDALLAERAELVKRVQKAEQLAVRQAQQLRKLQGARE